MKTESPTAKAFIVLLVLPLLTAASLAVVWALVDWLRSYGSGVTPFPFLDHSTVLVEPFRQHAPGTILGIIEDMVNTFNRTFRGASRFGAEMGLIAGSFIAIGFFKSLSLPARLCAGIIAGAMIGAAGAVILGSGAPLFIVGVSLGSIMTAIYLGVCAGPAKIASLPEHSLTSIS